MDDFKDHFSEHAAGYAQYRPSYPDDLFAYLAGLAPGRALAWDCATGSGQAAVGLAPFFDHVVATDASSEQLRHATPHPQVSYRQATASDSGLDARSVDLVTAAQAVHWFDFDAFYREVRRVLRPEGVITVWTYFLAGVDPAVDAVVKTFYRDVVGPYWPAERAYVDRYYQTIPFPFDEIETPGFTMAGVWRLADLAGYLRTWSATRAYVKAVGDDPVDVVYADLRRAWGDPEVPKTATWPVAMRAGKVGGA